MTRAHGGSRGNKQIKKAPTHCRRNQGVEEKNAGQSRVKSVDTDTVRQRFSNSAVCAFLASIAATVSLPSGNRTGGLGTSMKSISVSASFDGSPGCAWFTPAANVRI